MTDKDTMISVERGALNMALNTLRRAGKIEIADELQKACFDMPETAGGGDEKAREIADNLSSFSLADLASWEAGYVRDAIAFIESQRRTIEEKGAKIRRMVNNKACDDHTISALERDRIKHEEKIEQLQARVKGWKAITTDCAPKCGETVLVSGFNENNEARGRWVNVATRDYQKDHVVFEEDFYPPTHWMPLPEPPINPPGEQKA